MITVWLNKYYPDSNFTTDIFETWNPHVKLNHIITEHELKRVVHTKDARHLLAELHKIQGYFSEHYLFIN